MLCCIMNIDVLSSNSPARDLQANTAAFEACSKERIQPFDDDEEDIWEEKEIKFAAHAKSRNRCEPRQWGTLVQRLASNILTQKT